MSLESRYIETLRSLVRINEGQIAWRTGQLEAIKEARQELRQRPVSTVVYYGLSLAEEEFSSHITSLQKKNKELLREIHLTQE